MKMRKYYEKDTGEVREELVFTREEQEAQYKENIKEILENTRYVLDTLEGRTEYQVDWKYYGLWVNGHHST